MPSCYSLVNTTESFTVSGQQKCGSPVDGASYCCNQDDTCLDDAICYSTAPAPGASGFYVAGCTDPDFPEPCSKSCSQSAVAGCCLREYSVGLLLSGSGPYPGLLRYALSIMSIYQIVSTPRIARLFSRHPSTQPSVLHSSPLRVFCGTGKSPFQVAYLQTDD